jgi:hypothetical protein
MKAKIFILSLGCIIAIQVNAQWTNQTSGTTKNLWGVSFVDQNVGFACGEAGTTAIEHK